VPEKTDALIKVNLMMDDHRKSMTAFMRNFIFVNLFTLLILYMPGPAAWGDDPQTIKTGDRAQLHIICKESAGEIILTTYPEVDGDDTKKKSSIYSTPKKFEPLRIVAGEGDKYSGADPLKPFNNELTAKLSQAIVGMRVGESVSLAFTAPVPEELKAEDRTITLSRKRMIPKKMTRPKQQFAVDPDQDPAVGREILTGLGLTAVVTAVKGDDLEIMFAGKEGDRIMTPWGTGILKDHGDKWLLELEPHIGRLVKTGNYVGRIITVEDDRYTIDFGFPFGNETILCDISIVSIMGKDNENE